MSPIPFTWNLQLEAAEQQRYDTLRSEKARKNEPWRNPEEIRENFIRGYAKNLEEHKHD